MRNSAIDTLRLLAIIGVILIHTTTRNLELANLDITRLPIVFFFNQITRFAVPLFFLISGYTLEINYSLIKRLTKILIPYLFWSFIYYSFVYTQHTTNFFMALLYGSSSYQLYFIPSLIIFYLIFPLFRRLAINKYILGILFITQIYFLYFEYSIRPLQYFYPFSIVLLNYFLFSFGIYVHKRQLLFQKFAAKYKYLLLIITIILGLFVTHEGRIQYLLTHNYLSFYSSWRISILFYTLSLFIFLFSLLQKISLPLSKYSFFVFFVHVLILELLTPYFGHSGFWLFFSVSTLSFATAYLVHRIPKISALVG